MSAATQACAPSGATWHSINWADVQRQVRRLQARIVKATQEGRHNKVKALQWLLTHSFSGKAVSHCSTQLTALLLKRSLTDPNGQSVECSEWRYLDKKWAIKNGSCIRK
ncbi:reverse transcriptase N-terminal domain-containing protein [Methylomarinum vadi]|uniref:reverse transcriptase N-terminal domain-containing protein n=1 Tax=Methylomarinum vadi TaxID=438855 RepID=UPI000A00E4E0|nr:reverse transcriptase N-terminal domain-containing protein [Methylomarinum vadi]